MRNKVDFENKNISGIIDFEELEQLQSLFSDTHGIGSLIIDTHGVAITKSKNIPEIYSKIIKNREFESKKSKKTCSEVTCFNPSGPPMQQCNESKLWLSGVNIIIEGEHIATWIIGQIRDINDQEEYLLDYADKIGVDKEEYLKALLEVPTMSLERFEKMSHMLSAFINQFVQKAHNTFLLKQKNAENEENLSFQKQYKTISNAILKASPDDITISDLNGQILLASEAAAKMFGYESLFNIENHTIYDFIHPDYRAQLKSDIDTIINGSEPKHIEYKSVRKDGSIFDIEANSQVIRDEFGAPIKLIFIVRDISKRKLTEKALKESEEKHRILFMESPDAYLTFSDDIIIDCNLAAERILGGNRSGIIGKKPSDFSPEFQPDGMCSVEKSKIMIELAIKNKKHTFEWMHRRFDGTNLFVEISLASTTINNKSTLFGIWRDITARNQQKAALVESESKYKSLFESANDAIFIVLDSIIIDCNKKAELLFKCKKEEIINQNLSRFNPLRQSNNRLSEDICNEKTKLLLTRGPQRFEWQNLCFDDTIIETEVNLQKLEFNQTLYVQAIVRNITDQKKREIELIESERSKSVLLSNLPGMVYRCNYDKDWTMQFVSNQCFGLTGYHNNQLIGNKSISFNDLILPQYRDYLWNKWEEAVAERKSIQVEYEIRTANNEIKWAWEQGVPIFDSEGNVEALEGFIVDNTESKLLEVQLKENEAQYRNLADSGVALIWKSGLDKKCNYFNLPWLKFTGKTLDQELGNGWTDGVHSEDVGYCFETYTNAFEKQEPFSMEYRLMHHSGEYRWIVDSGTPNYNYNNQFIGYIGHCFDVTNRKIAEKQIQKNNEELSKSNAEKDKFFSIIAHDLRSPFTSFLGLTQIMSDELSDFSKEELKSFAESMKNSASSLYNLLENLLEWARMKRGLIPFFPKLASAKILLTNAVQPLIELAENKEQSIKINPTNISLIADEYMMASVIRNIVSNAIKFSPKKEEISLSVFRKPGSVELQISDNGIGMSPEVLKKLFRVDEQICRIGTDGEPSSGLGLILCKEFIDIHKGKIWVESTVNRGTTFFISIPNPY